MRKKPTLIVAGLTVAGAAGAFASTGSAIASTAAPSHAAASAPVDCAGIASSFGSQVPDSLTTFYDTVTASSSQIPKVDAPLTLFIPDNAAFDKIPANVLDSILADGDLLATILDYHLILGQALTADALAAAGSEPTARGRRADVRDVWRHAHDQRRRSGGGVPRHRGRGRRHPRDRRRAAATEPRHVGWRVRAGELEPRQLEPRQLDAVDGHHRLLDAVRLDAEQLDTLTDTVVPRPLHIGDLRACTRWPWWRVRPRRRSAGPRLATQADRWFADLGATLPESWALMAVGGYARGALCPGSDLDVMLVHPSRARPSEVTGRRRAALVPVLGRRLEAQPGGPLHQVAARTGRSDLVTATSILGVRHARR